VDIMKNRGIYPWFPEHGISLVHPDDLSSFSAIRPSGKVFEFVGDDQGYIVLKYGNENFRVKPDLYKPVTGVDFYIGDSVCVTSKVPEKYGVIVAVEWHFKGQKPIYYLQFDGKRSSRRYSKEELQCTE
jgi:hypothetical protein